MRLLAIQQLGRDYMAAGLYDRAEDMFNQLTDETDFRIGALQQLLQIYQATSEFVIATGKLFDVHTSNGAVFQFQNSFIEVKHHADLRTYFHFFAS